VVLRLKKRRKEYYILSSSVFSAKRDVIIEYLYYVGYTLLTVIYVFILLFFEVFISVRIQREYNIIRMITFVLLMKRANIIDTFLTQANTIGIIRQKIVLKWFYVAYSILLKHFTTAAEDPIRIVDKKKNVIRKVTNAIPRRYIIIYSYF